jgi:hypothetical protein
MKIWKLTADVNNYDSMMADDSNYDYTEVTLDGTSRADGWEPVKLKRMYGKGLPLSDFPHYYGDPIMSEKAINVLAPIIKDSVEYLPMMFDEKNYTMVNVIKVVNVVDYDKAVYKTFSDGKRILAFRKYIFRICDDLLNNDIFKLVDEPRRAPFVSDRFKKYVEDNNLTGFEFELVWDSDESTEEQEN